MNNKNILSLCISLTLFCANANASAVNLSSLYKDSLENNPELKSAAYEIERAQRQQEQISGLYRPQVDAGLQYGALRNDWTTMNETDGQGAEASLRAGQNLYNSELNASARLAEQTTQLTQVSYQVALEGLKLNVAASYLNAFKQQESLKQAQANLEAIGEQLAQMKHRFANGLVPENDVKETQAQYDLSLTSVIFAENSVDKALDALYELTGKSYDSVLPLALEQVQFEAPKATFSQWEQKAQKANPQMQIQQQLVSLSREQIALAEAGHMPTLGLVAEYRYAFASQSRSNGMNDSKGDFNDLDNNSTLFAGIAMSLPVYRGGATTSKVEQANIQYQQSLQLQEQTWREVTRDIRSTEKDLRALESAERAYQQAVRSAKSALVATEQGFEVGNRTIVDVLNATTQLYQARQQLSNSQIDFLIASLQLRFLAGELTEQDLIDVNALTSQKAL
ncbi:TolC family outer membrane protein [Vibrio astriarenae]|uniref:TolC family outer membrane protein n=1 Tax=Vibrio astriarenae TaxID=1481923 RepID=A0A7Z2YFK3_9VIBR|nr:TolC family outer membrane protein [Vibrio astriarenae]QIA65568.1 TolC family outer membrane protein [Vibrio astriarenae]